MESFTQSALHIRGQLLWNPSRNRTSSLERLVEIECWARCAVCVSSSQARSRCAASFPQRCVDQRTEKPDRNHRGPYRGGGRSEISEGGFPACAVKPYSCKLTGTIKSDGFPFSFHEKHIIFIRNEWFSRKLNKKSIHFYGILEFA